MDEAQISRFRDLLQAELASIEALQASSREERKPVELDQLAVGRLSRMDAMQIQAMAKASDRRREQSKTRIRNALARIEDGEFGHCTRCGEDIAPKRLEIDPTVPLCIGCASGSS